MLLEPTTIEELQEAVRLCLLAIPVGAGTKPALSAVAKDYQRISTLHVSGVVEYDPTEFTITVLAGTPLREIEKALSEHGQYLPFDPPLAAAGATIGGTVAAGLSGPGAFRFGPIRDFLIGVRFIDGKGRLITGGGKVVKNAAGFDTPKFLIGSCGRLGVLAELTFKVFPKPAASATFAVEPHSLMSAIRLLQFLSNRSYDLDALEYEPGENMILGRIRGNPELLEVRLDKIESELPGDLQLETFHNPAEAEYFWKRQLGFDFSSDDHVLAKIPITPNEIEIIEAEAARLEFRQYSMGGNVAWVSSTASLYNQRFIAGMSGQILRQPPHLSGDNRFIGIRKCGPIHYAIESVFDPAGKFPRLYEQNQSKLASEGPSPIDSRPDSD